MTFETILTPELVEEYTSQGLWVDRTITDYLDDVAARTPEKTAFIDPRRQVSCGALKDQVDRDLARIDADGYVNISGRTKDVIIRGGENIPVSYVENVLYENPKLDSVAIVAVPDPRLQERACACVILKPDAGGFTFEEMQQFLAEKGVAKQYWPEKLEILPDFPKTPSGKIRKFELRDQINAGGA